MSGRLSYSQIVWRRIYWPRPLPVDDALAALRALAVDAESPLLVLEARADSGGVSYLLGGQLIAVLSASLALEAAVPGIRVGQRTGRRTAPTTARKLRISTRHRPLRSNEPDRVARSVLAALNRVSEDETLVLQLLIGPRRVPLAIPNNSPSSIVAPWWQTVWSGNGGQVDPEKRGALRAKVADHGFAATLRISVRAGSPVRRQALLLGVFDALRLTEAPGVKLRLAREAASRAHNATAPWLWPLRLGASEALALTAWPVGEGELPGQPPLHPRQLAPAPGTTGTSRVVARASAPGLDAPLALPVDAALHHLHVLGPTGTGKSTLLINMISQDMSAGRAIVVVDPQGDLVSDVLKRVPSGREHDVVIIDPSDVDAPVGLNPLLSRGRRPEIVADGLLAVFKGLYGEALGPRSTDILHSCLLTLAKRDDASLVMLPLLLTNPGFRRSVTKSVNDPIALGPFWAWFEALSEGERQAAIAPIQNKLRQWLLRPSLRNVLGQLRPRFSMVEAFHERRIVLVSLAQGQLGPEGAALLGALVVAELWQATQDRTRLASGARRPVMVYLDEFSAFLHLPTDLGDALARSRGMGVGYTLAHQFLGQLNPGLRAAVLANTRSRVCFQLGSDDAAVIARGAPELATEDFTSLGRYEVYASLFAAGAVTPYASAKTLAPPPAISSPAELRRLSRSRYGRPLSEIEAGFAELIAPSGPETTKPAGRQPRRTP